MEFKGSTFELHCVNVMEKFLKLIDNLSEGSGKIFSFLTLATVAIIIPEVIARYGFHYSFLFVHEGVWFLCGALYMLGGAYCFYLKGHVNVDVLYGRFQLRKRMLLDLITFPFFLMFCGLLFWQGFLGAYKSIEAWEVTVTPWGGACLAFEADNSCRGFSNIASGVG